VLAVLAARGHRDDDALASLFDPPETALHDPRLLPGAATFAARIEHARVRSERVLVVGDFDADGLTGLAIMVRALRALGIDTSPYVPDRQDEGHGLSLAAVDRARREGRTVIVTVDCGISSVPEVDVAIRSGIDVLVSDHHRIPGVLPRALTIVDPHLAGSRYPHPDLAGSGVAFKLAQLLLADQQGGQDAAMALADLAGIGSVADLVPIVGENRAIVRLGLERLRGGPRPALEALLRHAGIRAERLDPEAIAFSLAPRLNALGRVGHAAAAASLLLTDDADEADRLAAELEAANLMRRELTASAVAEAEERLADAPEAPITILVGDWPVGVIGLVAGRLAERTGRPAVVFSSSSEPWRGSARSAAGFDLAAAFAACAELFERHGGHPTAAGCSLRSEAYGVLRERLMDMARALPEPDPRPALRIDLLAGADDVDHVLFRELTALDRSGGPPVLLGISGLRVARAWHASGGHLALVLRKGKEVLDGICFGRSEELLGAIAEGQEIDLVARLTSRSFGGFESLQLEVRDVAPPGHLAAASAGTGATSPVLAGAVA
jgi:single-stranded-DNA-specific exonuclease